jgi:hypothetical protein
MSDTMMQPTQSTMKAIALDRFGGLETMKLQMLPVPEVGPDEVLIHVEWAGVGQWDPFEREGGFAILNLRGRRGPGHSRSMSRGPFRLTGPPKRIGRLMSTILASLSCERFSVSLTGCTSMERRVGTRAPEPARDHRPLHPLDHWKGKKQWNTRS